MFFFKIKLESVKLGYVASKHNLTLIKFVKLPK